MPPPYPSYIFQYRHPILSVNPPNNTTDDVVVKLGSKTEWQVTLTRSIDYLDVKIKCLDRGIPPFSTNDYIHLLPVNSQGKSILCSGPFRDGAGRDTVFHVRVPAEALLHDGQYDFHVIQVTGVDVPWYIYPPSINIPQTHGGTNPPQPHSDIGSPESTQLSALPVYQETISPSLSNTMSMLLQDVYSVDTEFVFKSDSSAPYIRLWAHRSILAKYPAFEKAINQACFASARSAVGPIKVSVNKVSFATFAALLKFVYTGGVDRTGYPSDFAISKAPTPPQVLFGGFGRDQPPVTPTAGGDKHMHRWHPLDVDTPLSDKPVTWQELLHAASVYGVDALRAHCRGVIMSESQHGGTFSNTK
ncbi:MAG: hypothetical protein BYD32DRAFT_406324 [Podila humilis]|nr:MAG: hypothetical protein BYD32DRAFT_406324 [Podila humilis]